MADTNKTSLWSLYRQMSSGRYHRHGQIEAADSIVGLSFGMRCDRKTNICVPDPSNFALAQYIERLEQGHSLPELLQHEIDQHIHGKYEVTLNVEYNKRDRKRYLDTYETLRQVKLEMKQRKLSRPIIVAQAFHVPRVDAVARRMGLDTIVLSGLPRVWDKESSQLWTRSRWLWIFRESLALIVYKLKRLI